MTLPQNVKDAVQDMGSVGPHEEVFGDRVQGWLAVISAHLLSQGAEIERLRNWNERVSVCRDHVADVVDGECLVCRLAVANALLRTIAAYTPPAHECERGCPKETCEACKLAKYLQGAGDEGGRPA